MSAIAAIPDWRATLDGKDLTDTLQPYLIQMRVQQRREDAADQLDIVLDDSGQLPRLALPPPGAVLEIAMGWKRPPRGQPAGLVDMGRFTVDEVEQGGPPDAITLRARSADFTSAWRKRREQNWEETELGAILREIAGRHGLQAKIDEELAARVPKLVTQSRESDIALMKRLGKEHHAVATVKAGQLLFLPLAGGKTADGRNLPPVTVVRSDGGGHRFRIAKREDYTGVTAKWHDKRAAEEKTAKVEGEESVERSQQSTSAGDDDNTKVLSKVYPSEAEAQRAADAEWNRIKRAPRSLSLTLAYGRADIGAEQPLRAIGFREEIDAENWLVASVDHSLDRNGFTSSLECEVPI